MCINYSIGLLECAWLHLQHFQATVLHCGREHALLFAALGITSKSCLCQSLLLQSRADTRFKTFHAEMLN